MNSLLASSLYGQDFIKYRLNNNITERNRFSKNIINKYTNEVPIIIDSIDPQLRPCDTNNYGFKRKSGKSEKGGKEYHFNKELTIKNILLEVQKNLNLENDIVLKIGLDNCQILNESDIAGEIYLKYKNKDDNILYLLLTKETTIYGYIMSLIKYVFSTFKT